MSSPMHARNPRSIIRLYDWLPLYGETSVDVRFSGSNLSVGLLYDGREDDSEKMLTLNFTGACSFQFTSTPGAELPSIESEAPKPLGDVIEYEDSDGARAWNAHYLNAGGVSRGIRHFHVWFLSANQTLVVFAQDCVAHECA